MTNEAFARVKIDALLAAQGWNRVVPPLTLQRLTPKGASRSPYYAPRNTVLTVIPSFR